LKKLVLLESEMTQPGGHFLDYLIETTVYFKKKFKIIWFLNKNCNLRDSYVPSEVEIKKIIISNNFRRKENKFLYFSEELFFFIKNFRDIFYFILFFLKNKKLKIFLKTLASNYFIIPRYFKSFYFEVINCKLDKNDHIFVQSCRRKDISCIYFFSNIESSFPKIHLRVFFPPRKKFKSFFFYLFKIEKFITEKKIFLYTEHGYKYQLIGKEMNSNEFLHKAIPIFSFSERFFNEPDLTIGFVGQARKDKGFHLLPELISRLESKKINLNYLIQFTSTTDMKYYEDQLFNLAKNNTRIKIVNKYCDYKEYRNILKKIDIMPILHDKMHLTIGNSSVIYSCITNEIPVVIPENCMHLKQILTFKSYEEAKDLENFVEKIILISNNFTFYLKEAKKLAINFKNTINDSALIKNLN
jgi:hypothetical protein